MNVCGTVAEFDPFHNGHLHLVVSAKNALGGAPVIAAMSGNFVQRGAPACFNKVVRTSAALNCGVDAVLQLPEWAALSTAEKFTREGVRVLAQTGIVTHIAFGSECGDVELLKSAAQVVSDKSLDDDIRRNLSEGMTYSAARQAAVRLHFGNEIADVFSRPNDILGVGYISAINELNCNITPVAITRQGAGHGEMNIKGESIASAAQIRQMIHSGEIIDNFVPEMSKKSLKSEPVFAENNADRAILSRIRLLSRNDYNMLSDVSEGLHNRLYDAAQNACCTAELYDLAKTKRYTHARIRRLFMCAALGIFDEPASEYLRVLGFAKDRSELLTMIKSNGKLPIVTSYSDAKKIGEKAAKQFEKSAQITDFYNLLAPKIRPCGEEYRQAVVRI